MSWQLQRWLFKAKATDINRPLYNVKDLPDTFESDDDYYQTLLSHVGEELRAQIHAALCETKAMADLTINDTHFVKKRDLFLDCTTTGRFQPADVLLLCLEVPWSDTNEFDRARHHFDGHAIFGIVDNSHPNGSITIKVGVEQESKVNSSWYWKVMKMTNFAPIRRVADALQNGLQDADTLTYLREDLYIGQPSDAASASCTDPEQPNYGDPLPTSLVSSGQVLHESPGLTDALLAHLNIPQINAVITILHKRQGISLLQGPPGTGKTTTIMGLLSLLLRQCMLSTRQMDMMLCPNMISNIRKLRLMLTAPSNVAVAQMASRLLNFGALDLHGKMYQPYCVLIGVEDAVDELSRPLLLSNRVDAFCRALRTLQQHLCEFIQFSDNLNVPMSPEDRAELSEQAAGLVELTQHLTFLDMEGVETPLPNLPPELTRELHKLIKPLVDEVKERLDSTRKVRLGYLRNQLSRFLRMVQYLDRFTNEDDAIKFILACADVFFCTLSSAGQRLLKDVEWHTVVVDEAAQAPEAEIIVVLKPGVQRLVLVGDPQQLPATVISQFAAAKGYGRSMMARLMSLGSDMLLLTVQYRMHPKIAEFPSNQFYDGRLTNGPAVLDKSYTQDYHRCALFQPFVFFDVWGSEKGYGMSIYNMEEVRVICNLADELISNYGVEPWQVAIISPYSAQVKALKNKLWKEWLNDGLGVKSVDSCQGAEYDVVLFSAVRTSEDGIGFLKDMRRLNVALTRAKYCLVVVGHAKALSIHPDWNALISHAQDQNVYYELDGSSLAAFSDIVQLTCRPRQSQAILMDPPADRKNTVVNWAIKAYLGQVQKHGQARNHVAPSAAQRGQIFGRKPDAIAEQPDHLQRFSTQRSEFPIAPLHSTLPSLPPHADLPPLPQHSMASNHCSDHFMSTVPPDQPNCKVMPLLKPPEQLTHHPTFTANGPSADNSLHCHGVFAAYPGAKVPDSLPSLAENNNLSTPPHVGMTCGTPSNDGHQWTTPSPWNRETISGSLMPDTGVDPPTTYAVQQPSLSHAACEPSLAVPIAYPAKWENSTPEAPLLDSGGQVQVIPSMAITAVISDELYPAQGLGQVLTGGPPTQNNKSTASYSSLPDRSVVFAAEDLQMMTPDAAPIDGTFPPEDPPSPRMLRLLSRYHIN